MESVGQKMEDAMDRTGQGGREKSKTILMTPDDGKTPRRKTCWIWNWEALEKRGIKYQEQRQTLHGTKL